MFTFVCLKRNVFLHVSGILEKKCFFLLLSGMLEKICVFFACVRYALKGMGFCVFQVCLKRNVFACVRYA